MGDSGLISAHWGSVTCTQCTIKGVYSLQAQAKMVKKKTKKMANSMAVTTRLHRQRTHALQRHVRSPHCRHTTDESMDRL